MSLKAELIKAGVKNLKTYGYPNVNDKNILKDNIYKEFFKSMLNDNKGNGASIDSAIKELLIEIG